MTSGPKEYEQVEYIDMYASCQNVFGIDKCDVFKRLRDAGATFCFFDVIAYVFTVIWTIKIVFIITQRPFLDKINPFICPGVGFFCHILAEIIWSGVTRASFSANCDDITSDSLCSLDAPAVVLVVTLFYILAFAIFILFHLKRFVPEDHKEEIENLDQR